MIISIDAGKAFNKIQHPFTIKTHNKVGMMKIYPNTVNVTANIILKSEKLKVFPLRSRQKMLSTLTTLIPYGIGSLSHSN